PVVGTAAGVMQGAVGVSGPVVAAWYHGYRLPKQTYVFTVTLVFGVAGAVQLAVLAATGAFDRSLVVASALAFIPVLAMIPVGTALRARLGGKGFERAVLVVLLCSAVALVLRVLG